MTNLPDTLAALKPCPFCGGNFKMGQEPYDNHPVAGMFYIYHEYGPLGSPARDCLINVARHFDTEAEAVAACNTRTGQLVPVPSAEMVRSVLYNKLHASCDDCHVGGLFVSGISEAAEAVIAAMKEGKP